jgi:hypothetical protein
MLRHREAWAVEQRAPTRAQFLAEREQREQREQRDQTERLVGAIPQASSSHSQGARVREERLVPQTAHDKQRHEHIVDTERLSGGALNRSPGDITRAPSVHRRAAAGTGWKPAASKELPMSEEAPKDAKDAKDVLIVISKVKAYIRAKSSMNTSDAVTEALSELVRAKCEEAIERAKSDGRKTVMARDITGGTGPIE